MLVGRGEGDGCVSGEGERERCVREGSVSEEGRMDVSVGKCQWGGGEGEMCQGGKCQWGGEDGCVSGEVSVGRGRGRMYMYQWGGGGEGRGMCQWGGKCQWGGGGDGCISREGGG